LAEVKRNLVAASGGLFRLPRAIGRSAAMEAILTGEPIPAERAYQLGMVNRLVAPGEATSAAMELAETVTGNAPVAVWESRKVVIAAHSSDDETLKAMSGAALATVAGSDDLKEGLQAFIEKRPPRWTGH
jgi:enoyl-CoA hydratase